NQGIKKRLEDEIRKSLAIRSARTKSVLVTGADGTIGKEVVKKLLRYDFTVHALVGDRRKAKEMFSSLNGSQMPLTLYEVDFEDPHEVAKFARGFVGRCTDLNVVVLCAGTMLAPPKFVDNIESHMCVNVVSQALLLHLLDPIMTSDTRVTALSSSTAGVAFFTSTVLEQGKFSVVKVVLAGVNEPPLHVSFIEPLSYYIGPYEAYCFSKLVLSTYIEELARQRPQNMVSLHPGVIPGTLYRHTNTIIKFVTYCILGYFLRSPSFSALLVLHTTLRDDQVSGAYYEDCVPKALHSRLSEKDKMSLFKSVQRQVEEWARLED
ncbi:oxidoreductase, short chain dehydrogenase/reductase family protein, partial [Ancylostoma duodenale]